MDFIHEFSVYKPKQRYNVPSLRAESADLLAILGRKRKQEIEAMLGLDELPALEETESGKDLIRIGEERGEERGIRIGEERGEEKAILVFLKAKFKTVPRVVRNKIHQLATPQKEKLLAWLPKCESLSALTAWLDKSRR